MNAGTHETLLAPQVKTLFGCLDQTYVRQGF